MEAPLEATDKPFEQAALEKLRQGKAALLGELRKVIVGQDAAVNSLIIELTHCSQF